MLGKFSFEYLGTILRKSPSSKSSGDFCKEIQQAALIINIQKQLAYVATGEEPPSERRVSDDLNAELPRSLQEPDSVLLDV